MRMELLYEFATVPTWPLLVCQQSLLHVIIILFSLYLYLLSLFLCLLDGPDPKSPFGGLR